MGQSRRTFTDEFKAAAVGRLYKPGATQTGVARELGVTSEQLQYFAAAARSCEKDRLLPAIHLIRQPVRPPSDSEPRAF
ncbi:transposase [Primorskyibacter flagellatus]|uniref:Transposase n=1 Tax=Primorskyibacter flagellatus TaxID=1387277 RepID=A0A1W2DXK1_9RHOB|nr:transposase [Primorskyibacter flagellatus]SMD02221.1 Transposase [Primorskyibacter flagellatus]